MEKILMKALVRPFIMLTTQPALQAMALFRGYQYGLMYLVFATFPVSSHWATSGMRSKRPWLLPFLGHIG